VVRLVARGQGPVQLLHNVVHHTAVRGVPNEQQLLTNTPIPKHTFASHYQITVVWVEQYRHKGPFKEVNITV
jgi:hypothetical protein